MASNAENVSIWWRHYAPKLYTWLCVLLWFNSLTLGRFQFNFRYVLFKLILVNGGWGISDEIALRWMPLDLTDDKSTLVQVIAWCHQATSHYLSQCWHRSMSPNGVTRPQWVNSYPPPPPWTKWLLFHRHYFQIHFCKWKILYFDSNLSEICSQGSN